MRQPLLLILASLFILIIPFLAHAETKILTAEANYTMGDGETPSFAEAMALQKAKQMALEQAGTYVESYTKIQNLDLTTEERQRNRNLEAVGRSNLPWSGARHSLGSNQRAGKNIRSYSEERSSFFPAPGFRKSTRRKSPG